MTNPGQAPLYYRKPYAWRIRDAWELVDEKITSQLLNLCSAYEEDEHAQIDLGKIIMPPLRPGAKHRTRLQKPGRDWRDTV